MSNSNVVNCTAALFAAFATKLFFSPAAARLFYPLKFERGGVGDISGGVGGSVLGVVATVCVVMLALIAGAVAVLVW